MAFNITSDAGVAVEGRVLVRGVGGTSRGEFAWALVGAPIESMLTAAGDAWSEFEHVEGNGYVIVLVASEWMDRAASVWSTAGNGAVACGMCNGAVFVNGALVRSIPDCRTTMAPGESVRVRYVVATRMVSVVWRGRAYDLAALPATADIAHMRFGVALGAWNSMRVTGASAGTCRKCFRWRICGLVLAFPLCYSRGVCLPACATQRTTSCRTCDSSRAPA